MRNKASLLIAAVLWLLPGGMVLCQDDQPMGKMDRAQMGAMHREMKEHWAKQDADLEKLLANMKAATTDAEKIKALEALVAEMVAQRAAMHAKMNQMHERMMQRMEKRRAKKGASPTATATPATTP